jgi:hypothetical protein
MLAGKSVQKMHSRWDGNFDGVKTGLIAMKIVRRTAVVPKVHIDVLHLVLLHVLALQDTNKRQSYSDFSQDEMNLSVTDLKRTGSLL